ncbi:hypothetical protein SVAN01_10578 [Stagonosporopsis vannaccii]|nr:hypothetical protein SVAN01_10578 [Stagonosporopsis vannaccii]
MVSANETKTSLTTTVELAEKKPPVSCADPFRVNVTRLPTGDTENNTPITERGSRTVLHIYFESECGHRVITPTLSPSQERRFGPKPKEQKARRIAKAAAKKLREASQLHPPFTNPDELTALSTAPEPADAAKDSYFLHTPYLSFHLPPSVLYIGNDRYAPSKPVALVHTGCFWRSYKIQLGPSLSLPGVIDPRGVVSWRHNGGSKNALKDDDTNGGGRLLKGYKVRGWRLWGEDGKRYVHGIRDKRKAGEVFDDPDEYQLGKQEKVRADEVVFLTWTRPLSRQTRLYTFRFQGIEFQWKGTGTVSEGRKCGWMLRFCHLKLVARVPFDVKGEHVGVQEVCLGKYTSSIAAEKSGTLEMFDYAVVSFVEQWMPNLLEEEVSGTEKSEDGDDELGKEDKNVKLKQSMLYQAIIATLLCMASAEKEKRHTIIDLLIGIFENAGNGGG